MRSRIWFSIMRQAYSTEAVVVWQIKLSRPTKSCRPRLAVSPRFSMALDPRELKGLLEYRKLFHGGGLLLEPGRLLADLSCETVTNSSLNCVRERNLRLA